MTTYGENPLYIKRQAPDTGAAEGSSSFRVWGFYGNMGKVVLIYRHNTELTGQKQGILMIKDII